MPDNEKKETRTPRDLSRVSSENVEIVKARIRSGAVERGIHIQETGIRSSAVASKKAQAKAGKDSK